MGDAAIDEVMRALSALESLDAGCDRERWVRILMAAKAAGLSFDAVNEWSASGANYSGEADTLECWRSIRDGAGVSAATLFHLAREAGWREGRAAPTRRKSPAKPEVRKSPRYTAGDVWAASEPATPSHPYIERKGGRTAGLRVYPSSASPVVIRGRDVRGFLVVPAFDVQGELTTLQFISPNVGGGKLNLPGLSLAGFFAIGEIRAGERCYIAEGIGAAWSVNAATDAAALVAFGSGNQRKVAESALRLGARVVVVADRGKEDACERAARELGCTWVAMPAALPPNGDINDVHQAEGIEAVRAVLARELPPAANDSATTAGRDDKRREQQQADNQRLQLLPEVPLPPALDVTQMEADCVWIAEGSMVGRVTDPQFVLSFTDFAGLTAASVSVDPEDPKARRVANAVLWKQSTTRHTVQTRTFAAGQLPICRDPDGRLALNSWRPIERWPASISVQPFLEQVAYLFPEATECNAFLCWLAHIEQRPGELPHYGWLHIAAYTGTGRNWLASLMARVWRGYVAPNVDLPALLDSQFNGQLAGRLLAIVDEVQEAAGDNPYRHTNKLKSLVNAEFRELNPKFGRQYREHNGCRWLVFSNHDNALPMNDTDRRWRVVRHTSAPRAAAEYTHLYSMLGNPEFVNAVGVHLRELNIATFNPGERPPMNDAKRAAVAASKTLVQQRAEELVKDWRADIVTNAEAAHFLSDDGERALTPAMRRALEEAGCVNLGRQVKVRGYPHRCWVLRNTARWKAAPAYEVVKELGRGRDGDGLDATSEVAA